MKKRALAALVALWLLLGCAQGEIVPLPLDGIGPQVNEAYFTSPTHYEDPSLTIDVYLDGRIFDTNYIYAVIKIADPSQLRTAMAYKYNSSYTVPGTVMAEANHAVLAINGDYYNFYDYGYLVRQGQEYRMRPNKEWDVLLIDQKGDFHIITEPSKAKISEWKQAHPDLTVINTFNFGPAMVVDGQWRQGSYSEALNFFQVAGAKEYARMAVCQLDELTYLFVSSESVLDENSRGMTLNEFHQCLQEIESTLGCTIQQAYNMDGGGSSTFVFHNEKINSLTNPKIRALSDIIYIVSAWVEE